MPGPTYFTSIGCMDGRIQPVVQDYGKQKFDVLYADTITEPGFVGVLAREALNESFIDDFKAKLFISTMQHISKGVIVFGHEECAGNPVSNENQIEEIHQSVSLIKELVGSEPPVLGLFVRKDPNNPSSWVIEEVSKPSGI